MKRSAVPRRVYDRNRSRFILLPRDAPYEPGETLYAYARGEWIVYRRAPPEGGDYIETRTWVFRVGRHVYTALPIPAVLADAYGIEPGSIVHVYYDDRVIAVKNTGYRVPRVKRVRRRRGAG